MIVSLAGDAGYRRKQVERPLADQRSDLESEPSGARPHARSPATRFAYRCWHGRLVIGLSVGGR